MSQRDPNLDSVELVADELGSLCDDLVLVGGCAVGLLLTDKGRPPVRATKDVDLLAEVLSKSDYYLLHEKLEAKGFKPEGGEVLCRWKKAELLIDVMPTDEKVLGFANRWYPLALLTANQHRLPSGRVIRVISPTLFLATKIEAFWGRGNGDYGHHDIEDIVNLFDGRKEIIAEIQESSQEVRQFIVEELENFLADTQFVDHLPWHMMGDEANQARVELVLERLRSVVGL